MIQIVTLLSPGDGSLEVRADYFDQANRILLDHGGRMISTSRPPASDADSSDVVHIVQFEEQAGFDAFRSDPRHAGLRDLRALAIREARLFFTDQYVTYID